MIDYNESVESGVKFDEMGNMSLKEVITRHIIEKKASQDSAKPVTRDYVVDQPNKYDARRSPLRVVQITVFDVMFDDQLCCLTYMHDITLSFKSSGGLQAH